MHTLPTAPKDLCPCSVVLGGTSGSYYEPPTGRNHNETLLRAKDIVPNVEINGGAVMIPDRGGR